MEMQLPQKIIPENTVSVLSTIEKGESSGPVVRRYADTPYMFYPEQIKEKLFEYL